jgi:putative peptidoglycan lipid II flippase
MLMAQAAIAQSVANAAMPTFSAQHALGKSLELRGSLAASLRGVILLAIPASVGLIVLRGPLVSMLYQYGKFDARSTELVAWALLWYAAGLVGHSIMEILTRAFYAQQDTKTPVLIGTLAMGLNVIFSFAFSAWFGRMGWMPHGGLALANSLATALEASALYVVMRNRLQGLEGRKIWSGFGAGLLSAGLMTAGLVGWIRMAGDLTRWVLVPAAVITGGILYVVGLRLLRVAEVEMIAGALGRVLRRGLDLIARKG